MTRKKVASKERVEILDHGHAQTFEKTDELREILTRLCHEGRVSLGKNLKEAREVLKFFKKELVDHVEKEEEAVFPFLETHLPKLQSAISLLRSEHEDFRRNLRRFQNWLAELSRKRKGTGYGKIVEKAKESGTYLTYLLQNHLQIEDVVFRIADRELRREEKMELGRLQRRKSHGARRTR